MQVQYRWTDGNDEDFRRFYSKTEDYYSSLVGGIQNRQAFVPYKLSQAITDVIIAEAEGRAAGCAGLKEYSAEYRWLMISYIGYLAVAGTNPLLVSSTAFMGYIMI